MKRNCTKKENRKQGTLQSCLNACQELESWIENGLVWFGFISRRIAHFALRVAASCGTCSRRSRHHYYYYYYYYSNKQVKAKLLYCPRLLCLKYCIEFTVNGQKGTQAKESSWGSACGEECLHCTVAGCSYERLLGRGMNEQSG